MNEVINSMGILAVHSHATVISKTSFDLISVQCLTNAEWGKEAGIHCQW